MNEWITKPVPAVPLNALRAFEVAARHMSIKQAALELHLTPSAVSHRLRQLELTLGCELLRREGSRLQLTEIGKRLAPDLTEGFARILGALHKVRQG